MPFNENGPLEGYKMVPEEVILLNFEIWHYDTGECEDTYIEPNNLLE